MHTRPFLPPRRRSARFSFCEGSTFHSFHTQGYRRWVAARLNLADGASSHGSAPCSAAHTDSPFTSCCRACLTSTSRTTSNFVSHCCCLPGVLAVHSFGLVHHGRGGRNASRVVHVTTSLFQVSARTPASPHASYSPCPGSGEWTMLPSTAAPTPGARQRCLRTLNVLPVTFFYPHPRWDRAEFHDRRGHRVVPGIICFLAICVPAHSRSPTRICSAPPPIWLAV